MDMEKIYRKALALDFLTADEALVLYESGPLDELMSLAWELRQKHVPGRTVTWQIDRNVNITNVCISGCKFCNFHCKPHDRERAYVTTIDQYVRKIDETLALGGDQLLLQGGLHPKLGIDFYENLFRELKRLYPTLKLHALGAPEVAHIARISGLTTLETLRRQAIDNGVEFIACQMSMEVMGVQREELLDNVTVGGVATYMERAGKANVNLFI
jgi:cyclic dehypoxanthinyl futalosine synthase